MPPQTKIVKLTRGSKMKHNRLTIIGVKHSIYYRLVACLLILAFSLTNIVYGYEQKSALRNIRAEEVTELAKLVESGIINNEVHALRRL
jgi:hypothetical protein